MPIGAAKKVTEEQAQEIRRRVANGDKKAAIARDFGIGREAPYQDLNRSIDWPLTHTKSWCIDTVLCFMQSVDTR